MPVFLMRHPAVDLSMQCCIGHTDIDLSLEGKVSLVSIATTACRLLPERLISSDLKRCRLLAEAIGARLNLKPEFDPAWREIYFGAWENRPWKEIRARYPEAFEDWAADFVRVAPPEGESFEHLHERFLRTVSKLDPGRSNILVVTHAGMIRAAKATFLKTPLDQVFEYQIPYGGIFRCPDAGGDAARSSPDSDCV